MSSHRELFLFVFIFPCLVSDVFSSRSPFPQVFQLGNPRNVAFCASSFWCDLLISQSDESSHDSNTQRSCSWTHNVWNTGASQTCRTLMLSSGFLIWKKRYLEQRWVRECGKVFFIWFSLVQILVLCFFVSVGRSAVPSTMWNVKTWMSNVKWQQQTHRRFSGLRRRAEDQTAAASCGVFHQTGLTFLLFLSQRAQKRPVTVERR